MIRSTPELHTSMLPLTNERTNKNGRFGPERMIGRWRLTCRDSGEVKFEMTSLKVETAHSCLDLLRITWASTTAEPKETVGILLEVSRSGGVLHVDEPVAPGTIVTIQLADGNKVDAEVQSFEEDEFGCYLALQVVGSWFPVQYWPSLMLPDSPSIPLEGALEPEPTIQTTQRFVIPSII